MRNVGYHIVVGSECFSILILVSTLILGQILVFRMKLEFGAEANPYDTASRDLAGLGP